MTSDPLSLDLSATAHRGGRSDLLVPLLHPTNSESPSHLPWVWGLSPQPATPTIRVPLYTTTRTFTPFYRSSLDDGEGSLHGYGSIHPPLTCFWESLGGRRERGQDRGRSQGSPSHPLSSHPRSPPFCARSDLSCSLTCTRVRIVPLQYLSVKSLVYV